MRSLARLPVLFTFPLLVALAGPQVVASGFSQFSGVASTDFTQCFARSECPGLDSCQDDELALGGQCYVLCYDEIPGSGSGLPDYFCLCSFVGGNTTWQIEGHSGWGIHGALHYYASGMRGRRESADSFLVRGFVHRHSDQAPDLPTNFAVFRFDGDPSEFDGVETTNVHDLVALGLIDDSDILWTAVYDGPWDEFDELVDVAGISDDEIVIFAAAAGSFPIPAVSTWGAILLVLLILVLTPLALRLRKRSA